jgi:hypothetical protein
MAPRSSFRPRQRTAPPAPPWCSATAPA